MGLNVHWTEFPAEIAETATACNLVSVRTIERTELLATWLRLFDDRLRRDGNPLAEAAARSATIGRAVRIELPNESFSARARGLDDQGRLIVVRDDGREERVAAGDVIHVRAV
jgi:BirA family biotin operon repressor/biotin-[acetyl-CoA-carboxylase] ligase